jgi:hypothetical protein
MKIGGLRWGRRCWRVLICIFFLFMVLNNSAYTNIIKRLAKKSVRDDGPKQRHQTDRELGGVADPLMNRGVVR